MDPFEDKLIESYQSTRPYEPTEAGWERLAADLPPRKTARIWWWFAGSGLVLLLAGMVYALNVTNDTPLDAAAELSIVPEPAPLAETDLPISEAKDAPAEGEAQAVTTSTAKAGVLEATVPTTPTDVEPVRLTSPIAATTIDQVAPRAISPIPATTAPVDEGKDVMQAELPLVPPPALEQTQAPKDEVITTATNSVDVAPLVASLPVAFLAPLPPSLSFSTKAAVKTKRQQFTLRIRAGVFQGKASVKLPHFEDQFLIPSEEAAYSLTDRNLYHRGDIAGQSDLKGQQLGLGVYRRFDERFEAGIEFDYLTYTYNTDFLRSRTPSDAYTETTDAEASLFTTTAAIAYEPVAFGRLRLGAHLGLGLRLQYEVDHNRALYFPDDAKHSLPAQKEVRQASLLYQFGPRLRYLPAADWELALRLNVMSSKATPEFQMITLGLGKRF